MTTPHFDADANGAQLTADAISTRDVLEIVQRRWTWIQALGREGAGGPVPDDQYHAYEYLAVPAGVYFGTRTWPQTDDIDGRLIAWRLGR
jgi:hypothetical protein